MTIAEKPIAAIAVATARPATASIWWRTTTARACGSTRTCTARRNWSMPRKGTMQVTTPKGRWLVPPDRAVWVPARLVHAIDVLADIEMRTLYFELAWLKRERRGAQPRPPNSWCGSRRCCIRRSSRCSIRATPPSAPRCWSGSRCSNCTVAEDSATFIPLPHEPRCRRAADIVLAATGRCRTTSRPRRKRSAPRRGRCRGCLPRRPNSASRAGASAPASRRRSSGCRPTPTSRSSSWRPSSAMPACRPSRMPSGR